MRSWQAKAGEGNVLTYAHFIVELFLNFLDLFFGSSYYLVNILDFLPRFLYFLSHLRLFLRICNFINF